MIYLSCEFLQVFYCSFIVVIVEEKQPLPKWIFVCLKNISKKCELEINAFGF